MSTGSKSSDALDEGTCAVMEASMLEEEGYFDPAASSGAGVTEAGQRRRRLDSLCRVCANASDYFIPIFEGEGAEHQLDMKIQKHLPIQVIEADCLPAQVCYQCASTLIAWHDLVTACVEADKKLHQLLQDNENDIGNHEEKVVEFFNEPPVDSEGDDFNEPSTSTAVVEVRECLPAQKRRISGKGKQHRKANVDNVLSESDVKSSTALSNSTEACADQKEYVESASSTERLSASPISTHACTRKAVKLDHTTINVSTSSCNIASGLKRARVSSWCDDAARITECVQLCAESLHESKPAVGVESKVSFFPDTCAEVVEAELCVLKHEEDSEFGVKTECKEFMDVLTSPVVKVSAVEKSWHKQKLEYFLNKKARRGRRVEARDLESFKVAIDGKTLYHCSECGKHLGRSAFINHLRIHTGEKPFTCHICGKQFRVSSLLNRHLRDVHEGIKNHPCEFCGRRFASKRSRDEHRITHTGERTCVCHLCGKAFKTKASLFVHNIFHSDKFPHECLQCNRRFRRRQQLNEHVRLHTGEKPYLCKTCGKAFRLQQELKRHESIHTTEKGYLCSVCERTFSQKRYLKSHMRVHEMKLCIEDSV